jgi:hypothetical protein
LTETSLEHGRNSALPLHHGGSYVSVTKGGILDPLILLPEAIQEGHVMAIGATAGYLAVKK